jgi:zinc transport system substrate-binding protein
MGHALCAALVVWACSADAPRDATGDGSRLVVAVAVPPQAYFVERVAGDLVQVEVLIPPGANPATYEPSVREMQVMARAALFLTVGHPAFPFEKAWLEHLLADMPKMKLIDGSPGEDDLSSDPHVWLAPSMVKPMVRELTEAIIGLLPQHTATLSDNLADLLADIDDLDAEIRAALQGGKSRRFAVFHPAWSHFAQEYGLDQLAVEADGKEPGPGALAQLIEQLRAEGIPVIFTQPAVSSLSAQVVASEIGATVRVLDPLARDWPKAMREAATAIAEALER